MYYNPYGNMQWTPATIVLAIIVCVIFVIAHWIIFTKATDVKLSRAFGHGIGFALGLIFLNGIFTLILAFGSSEYRGVPKRDF